MAVRNALSARTALLPVDSTRCPAVLPSGAPYARSPISLG